MIMHNGMMNNSTSSTADTGTRYCSAGAPKSGTYYTTSASPGTSSKVTAYTRLFHGMTACNRCHFFFCKLSHRILQNQSKEIIYCLYGNFL